MKEHEPQEVEANRYVQQPVDCGHTTAPAFLYRSWDREYFSAMFTLILDGFLWKE